MALSIKYSNYVLKTLAISGSLIYGSIVDHTCLNGPMNEQMGLSVIVVAIAMLNYTRFSHGRTFGEDDTHLFWTAI